MRMRIGVKVLGRAFQCYVELVSGWGSHLYFGLHSWLRRPCAQISLLTAHGSWSTNNQRVIQKSSIQGIRLNHIWKCLPVLYRDFTAALVLTYRMCTLQWAHRCTMECQKRSPKTPRLRVDAVAGCDLQCFDIQNFLLLNKHKGMITKNKEF